MKKFIIAIDFDGVIAQINKDWVPGTPNYPCQLVEDDSQILHSEILELLPKLGIIIKEDKKASE